MPPSMPDPNLIARSKEFSFILHWHLWHGLYNDELSKRNKMGFGYRCGVFLPQWLTVWLPPRRLASIFRCCSEHGFVNVEY